MTPPDAQGLRGALLRRGWLIVSALVLIGIAAAYAASNTNAYCSATCHTMTGAAHAWRASSHASTACIACHEDSPVDAVSKRMRHTFAEVSAPATISPAATVSSRRCLACHESVLRGVATSADGIKVEHARFVVAGTDCMGCHPRVGHETGPTTRSGTMIDCLRCHDDTKALGACFVCHTTDPE